MDQGAPPLAGRNPQVMRGFFSLGLIAVLWSPAAPLAAFEIPGDLRGRLASEAFEEREEAQAELLRRLRPSGNEAALSLLRFIPRETDPEVRSRCLAVLKDLVGEQYLQEDGAKGYLGVQMAEPGVELPEQEGPGRFGVIVTAVWKDTAAGRAGLLAGDIIVSINGVTWHDENASEGLKDLVSGFKPGTEVVVRVLRGFEALEFTAVLGRRSPTLDERRFLLEPLDHEKIEREDREQFFQRWLLENRPAG